MVAVDDLIISLQIRETGRLGKLQKQLTALVGPKGTKPASLGGGVSSKLISDVAYIRRRIIYLLPQQIYGSSNRQGQALEANTVIMNVKRDKRALARRLMTMRDVESQKDEYQVETEGALLDRLEDRLDEWARRSEDIVEGRWTGPRAEQFILLMRQVISSRDLEAGERKTLVTKIEGVIGERNKELEKIIRKAGISVKGEQFIGRMRDLAIPSIFPEKFSLNTDEEKKEFLKAFGVTSEGQIARFSDILTKVGELETKEGKDYGTTELLDFIYEEFGKRLDLWNLKEGSVKSDESLKMVTALLVDRIQKSLETGQGIGVPLQFQQEIIKGISGLNPAVLDVLGDKIRNWFARERVDYRLTDVQGDMDAIIKFFPDLEGRLDDLKTYWLERKPVATETNVAQLLGYIKSVGPENISLMAAKVLNTFREASNDMVHAFELQMTEKMLEMGFRDPLKTHGELAEISDEYLSKMKDDEIENLVLALKQRVEETGTTFTGVAGKIFELLKTMSVKEITSQIKKAYTPDDV